MSGSLLRPRPHLPERLGLQLSNGQMAEHVVRLARSQRRHHMQLPRCGILPERGLETGTKESPSRFVLDSFQFLVGLGDVSVNFFWPGFNCRCPCQPLSSFLSCLFFYMSFRTLCIVLM